MSDDPRNDGRIPLTSAVPSSRISRLARMGWLATGVAGGMLAEGARQLAQGKRPRIGDLLLTPTNARRVAHQLAQMRGAAMKVGQLLSMDAGDLLPPELAAILARLRSQARPMPKSQVAGVLEASWGQGWEKRFTDFSWTPLAAASIGQVHRAQALDGRRLAIKIQYPGVRASIDSDVDNVASLLRLSGLLPKGLDIQPLLEEAKRELHDEADYLREGGFLQRFTALLADAPEFVLPQLQADLTTHSVLTMSLVGGVPVESLLSLPQQQRDRLVRLLLQLLLRELFEFRLVQTDPNFANYRFDVDAQQLILLDFGATRVYTAAMVKAYRKLLGCALVNDRDGMGQAAAAIGYFSDSTPARHRDAVLDMMAMACEPFRLAGDYDFDGSDLPARLRDAGLALGLDRAFWHVPPANVLFLQRKLGGLYLLAARLQAKVNLHQLVQDFLDSKALARKPQGRSA
jgi:predicted unusual protein kinase regulating ubiquinone biosynthesis (AarF/ABC1/UbiB family)